MRLSRVHIAINGAVKINGKWMDAMTQSVSDSNWALNRIAEESTDAISQLVQLLDQVPGVFYRQRFGARKQQVIGKHVRHIIDHYNALLAATSGADELLDYENRNRDLSLETDRRAARAALVQITQALRVRFEGPGGSELSMRHSSAGEHQIVKTSVERELVFLASHTIHHMAIVGMLADQAGVEVSLDFGVHPSTLRYLEGQVAGLARSA
jgi:uncharacterized damage-inducible protein DinB